jgi:hypothetical protein
MWDLSLMNSRNNINDVGEVSGEHAYTLDKNGGLLAVQEAMVRKVVTQLNDFGNLYYEIMNEPYTRNVPMAWQEHIIDVIIAAKKELAIQHLISLNIGNGKAKVEQVHPAVPILNFHYAWPPNTVDMNYALGRVVGDNETGFKGASDFYYRREAWAFILSGGGLYNNLDYSFTVGHEDGRFASDKQPGGGSAALRFQLKILSTFIHGFNFVRMAPSQVAGGLPEGFVAYALGATGKQYAVYLCRQANEPPAEDTTVELLPDLPSSTYRFEWLDTLTGEVSQAGHFIHDGGKCLIASPAFREDIALRVIQPRTSD